MRVRLLVGRRGRYEVMDAAGRLTNMGVVSLGINSDVPNGQAWLGQNGAYRNQFVNDADEDSILVLWGVAGSWVNAVPPTITVSLAAGADTWISFADGVSGAWAAICPDTQLVNGQTSNTWGEFTFKKLGVVDVSREVNMEGHAMSIGGPTCTSNMDIHVFMCSSGTICLEDYFLQNCEETSQVGASNGLFNGNPSGGCGWEGASVTLTTTFS